MARFFTVFLITGLCIAALVFTISSRTGKPGISASTSFSVDSDGYHQSNELISPYQLSKNPYQYKGHSGLLLTTLIQLVRSDGLVGPQMPWPGGGMRFVKMLDEHTAIYSVLTGQDDVSPDTQIAVELPDSNPPTSTKLWRVYVEGADDFENGFGATIQVAKIKFEGYGSLPPPQPSPSEQKPSLPPPADQTIAPVIAPQNSADTGDAVAAPIERRALGSDSKDIPSPQTATARPVFDESNCAGYLDSGGDGAILSNSQGVNFNPYIQAIVRKIRDQAFAAVPEDARPPLNKPGDTRIRFSIGADGTLLAMHLDGTPYDDVLAKSTWGVVREQQFPPLPTEFHGPCLTVRIQIKMGNKPH
jgi:hypothetical protein